MSLSPRAGAVLAALAGSLLALVAWLAVCAPPAMGLLHPRPVAPPAAAPSPAHATEPAAPDATRRPVAAILLSQAGTEVTDFLAPYAILAASGTFTVHAVAPTMAPAPTNGGLGILPELTLDALDSRHPRGVDVVVLPNVLDPESSVLRAWVREQAARGATVVSICEGARLLAGSGLLDGREATTHFAAVGALRAAYPHVRWRDDRRWVEDGAFLTSAGVTAAIDASLRIVERFGGAEVARSTASALALPPPRAASAAAPTLGVVDVAVGLLQGAFAWPKRHLPVPLADGIDEIALAAVLDAYPRTFAARTDSTTPGRGAVRSRHGLALVPSLAAPVASVGEPDPAAALAAGEHDAMPAFDRVLRAIADDLGGPTAALVAVQLEYPAAHLDLRARPAKLGGLVLRCALLLGTGALLGLGVRARWRRRRSRARAPRSARAVALLVLACGVGACGGPLGPIAGGRLSGTPVAGPVEDWSFAAGERLLQVEKRPDDPYSVNVAFALDRGRLYLDLGAPDGWHRWRRFARADPRVRLRVADRVYAARLVEVNDARELALARAAFVARDIEAPAPGATVVRLVGVARALEPRETTPAERGIEAKHGPERHPARKRLAAATRADLC